MPMAEMLINSDTPRNGPLINYGRIDRSHLGSIGFGVVGPNCASGEKSDSLGRATPTVSYSCVSIQIS